MSTALIMVLDREIPKEMLNNWLTVTREFSNEKFEMGIEDASEILKKNSKEGWGYDLPGYAYDLWRTNGSLFYIGSDISKGTKIPPDIANSIAKEYAWVFDVVKKLINDGYSVKLFTGYFGMESHVIFNRHQELSIKSLKDIYTIFDENVLYTIYDEKS